MYNYKSWIMSQPMPDLINHGLCVDVEGEQADTSPASCLNSEPAVQWLLVFYLSKVGRLEGNGD